MSQQTDPNVIQYLGLRKAVGIIGVSLPFLLIIGRWIGEGFGFEPTISDYYYTNMGDVFVGCMCAIGIFLMSVRGFNLSDRIAGLIAFVFAVTVAFFPTTDKSGSVVEPGYISTVHITSAALLFTTLAYFCLFEFTKMAPNPTQRKLKRNTVYRVSGITILISIVLIAVFKGGDLYAQYKPGLIFESLAIEAFGIAWLTKGEAILKDEIPPQPDPERDRMTAAAGR
jgi:hypothetical protein